MKQESEASLRRSVLDSVRREVREAEQKKGRELIAREDRTSTLRISPEFMPELEKMAGPDAQLARQPDFGLDLLGNQIRPVGLGLERAVKSTVENNLAVQFARIAPAISQAKVSAAEAAFDWVVFANTQNSWVDSPRVRSSFSGLASGPNLDRQNTTQTDFGLRRNLITGGRFTLQQDLDFTDNRTPGITNDPDPAVQLGWTIQYDQPLLRGSGSEVALSEIRLARNAERKDVSGLRRDLIERVTNTEKTYWQLMQAHRNLLIAQSLLALGEVTYKQLQERIILDAQQAQIAAAGARVERRRADVLRARTGLRQVSDQLKALINDPELPVGAENLILPADFAIDQPISFSLAESILTAVSRRPEIEQAVLTIDDTSIRQVVAENARLPQLDLRLQARLNSLDTNAAGAYDYILSSGFQDYLVGLVFEQPIGNRKAESEMTVRRLERSQAVIAYRNAVQQITLETKLALERVVLNYALIAQTRTSRIAAAESLRAFRVEKEFKLGFTVDTLNLELQRQEELAQAERDEIQALADYNSSIADLYSAMGTALERNNIRFVVPNAETIDRKSGFEPK